MNESDILQARLHRQMLQPALSGSIQDVVARMGALQAQDYTSVTWAIGSRVQGSTMEEVENALDGGELIRTHVLRPTWHVVSAKDVRWMLELTAARIKQRMKPRDTQLGLTPTLIKQSESILVKALEGGVHLTKESLNVLWNQASIPTTEYRDAHLLMHAELDGLACSGKRIGKSLSYALLDERVPMGEKFSKEEALAKLAERYFNSHGPATLQDFIWWSGLNVGDAKQGIESVKNDFHAETIGLQTYLIPDDLASLGVEKDVVHVLPAYDEFIIAYQDRTATLIPADFQKIVSNNGVFRPALLLDGKVVGVWKRTIKKGMLEVEATLFCALSRKIHLKMEEAFKQYGHFQGLKVEIKFRKSI
jgi:hypothetical protein